MGKEGKETKKGKQEELTPRDKTYLGLAQAIAKATGDTEIPRVKEGLLLKTVDNEGNEKDLIVRVIEKKNPVTETPKQILKP